MCVTGERGTGRGRRGTNNDAQFRRIFESRNKRSTCGSQIVVHTIHNNNQHILLMSLSPCSRARISMTLLCLYRPHGCTCGCVWACMRVCARVCECMCVNVTVRKYAH